MPTSALAEHQPAAGQIQREHLRVECPIGRVIGPVENVGGAGAGEVKVAVEQTGRREVQCGAERVLLRCSNRNYDQRRQDGRHAVGETSGWAGEKAPCHRFTSVEHVRNARGKHARVTN